MTIFDGRSDWRCTYCDHIGHGGVTETDRSPDYFSTCRFRSYFVNGECPAYLHDVADMPIANPRLRSISEARFRFSSYWRAKAEEVRIIAEDFSHPETRDKMLRIAEGYDDMARSLDTN
jgi:hypothetical protein